MASSGNNRAEVIYIPRLALAVCVLTIALYFNILDHPLTPADQILLRQITHGDVDETGLPALQAELYHFNLDTVFRPLAHALLQQQGEVWGNSPSSYHSVSLIAFLACVILFMFFTGHLTRRRWVVIISSLIFALHPLASQSVLSLQGLSGLMALASVLSALILSRRYQMGLVGRHKVLILLLVLFQVVAAGSHEFGYLLPVFLGLQWLLMPAPQVMTSEGSRHLIRKRGGAEKEEPAAGKLPARNFVVVILPLIFVIFVFSVWRFFSMANPLPPVSTLLESGSRVPLLQSAGIFLLYVLRLAWPERPTLFYDPVHAIGLPMEWVVSVVAFLALIGLLVFRLRGYAFLVYGFWIWIVGVLGFSHFMRSGPIMSELYILFMLPGFSLVMGGLAGVCVNLDWRFRSETILNRGVFCLVWIVMILCGWQTWQRNQQWQQSITLLEAESMIHPANTTPRILGAINLIQSNDLDGSLEWIGSAEEIAGPPDMETLLELEVFIHARKSERPQMVECVYEAINRELPASELHYIRLAAMCGQFTDYNLENETEKLLRRALQFYPRSYSALARLAELKLSEGRLAEAVKLSQKAVNSASTADKLNAVSQYGLILGDYALATMNEEIMGKAIFQLRDVIETDRSSYRSYLKLTEILIVRGQYERAVDAIHGCLDHSRPDSYVDVARLYCRVLKEQGRIDFATQWLEQTIRSHPQDIRVQIFAGRFLEANKVYEKARRMFESLRLLNLQGSLKADVLTGLALVAANSDKNYELAWDLAREAQRADSDHKGARRMANESRRFLYSRQKKNH